MPQTSVTVQSSTINTLKPADRDVLERNFAAVATPRHDESRGDPVSIDHLVFDFDTKIARVPSSIPEQNV